MARPNTTKIKPIAHKKGVAVMTADRRRNLIERADKGELKGHPRLQRAAKVALGQERALRAESQAARTKRGPQKLSRKKK